MNRPTWLTKISVLILSFSVMACSLNPTTGRRQLNMLNESQEIQMGIKSQNEFIDQNGGLIPSKRVQDYVSQLGMAMAKTSKRANLPWEFHALNSSTINAFALPGGKIFITRGLMERLESKAQLAGVLGHEIGHVTAKHFNDKLARQMGVSIIGAGITIYAQQSENDTVKKSSVLAPAILATLALSYDRNQEHESDELGLKYMTNIGLNPQGQLKVMEVLASVSSKRSLEILSTHPYPESRINRIQQLLDQNYPAYLDDKTYDRSIDSYQKEILAELKRLPPAPKPKPAESKQTENKHHEDTTVATINSGEIRGCCSCFVPGHD